MAFHVKKGDTVLAIAGGWKGARGKVLEIFARSEQAAVEFPRRNERGEPTKYIKKAIRKNQDNPQGGFIDQHPRVHVSNLVAVTEEKTEGKKKKAASKKK